MTIFYCGRRETAVDWEVKIADFVVLLGKDVKKVTDTNDAEAKRKGKKSV